MTTLIRLEAVKERTALSRSKIYELLAGGKFPKPVKLDGGRLNAWPVREIDEYINARVAERDATA